MYEALGSIPSTAKKIVNELINYKGKEKNSLSGRRL
jgi:hypothetical protein